MKDVKNNSKEAGFIEIQTNTDKVKINQTGSSKKVVAKSYAQPKKKTASAEPAAVAVTPAAAQPAAQAKTNTNATEIKMSEKLKNFEEYEKMESNQGGILDIFNFKKHFGSRNKNKIKKDKFARRLEREERKKNKLPKLKKLPPLESATRFKPTAENGLSTSQVEQRMQEGYFNAVLTKTTKSYLRIFLSNIFTFFNVLCFAVAGALLYVKAYSDVLFVVIFVVNMAISIIQEIKAKRTVEKISLLTAPSAVAIRDGKRVEISIEKIVLDDIIAFQLGKQVCADSIIISGEVEVNESLLTGESVSVKKKVGDMLYAGSFISSGKCIAKVEKIGEYNYSSTLVSKAQEFKKRKSELLHSIQLIIKVIAFIIIPLGILMYLTNSKTIADSSSIIAKTAGSIVSMIPAGMYLLTTMALAVGVIKLARKRTLVQDLYSIEMLSRVDVICLDKTGTITDGTMKVNSVIQVSNSIDTTLHDVIGSMLTALDDNNQTSLALASHFGYSKELTPVATLPFSSQRKLSAVSFEMGKTKKDIKTYAFGAPEFVLKNKDAYVEKMVKQYAAKGFRVLILAESNGKIEKDKLPSNMNAIAIIIIEDRIRENAAETLKWFTENSVGIKIISGDNPLTVSEVSRRVGVPNAEKFISLEGLTKQQVVEAASKYTVFGRVSPDQKSILVRALKAEGKKVAMTGDGVNDILALKEADCSIAMASGSEAARNVSQVVLLDSNFSSMPSIVGEGRRVINNISKSSALFLMKTFFSIFITILCIIAKVDYPFSPIQFFLLEFFVIGLPSFVLALQPNKDPIRGNFLYNLISKALPGAILFTMGVVACYLFDKIVGTGGQFETMAALILTFTGLSILYRICKPFDILRGFLVLFVTVCIILGLTVFPISFFKYDQLTLTNILVVMVFVQFAYTFYNGVVRMTDAIMGAIKKRSVTLNHNYKPQVEESLVAAETVNIVHAEEEYKQPVKKPTTRSKQTKK